MKPNLTPAAQVGVQSMFRVLAGLFDLFVFSYIGLTLFVSVERFYIWSFTVRGGGEGEERIEGGG